MPSGHNGLLGAHAQEYLAGPEFKLGQEHVATTLKSKLLPRPNAVSIMKN